MRALALGLLLLAAVVAAEVVTVTDATHDEVVASSDFVLIEYYAPWCGHCKKLEPEWKKAAEALKGVAVLGALDATVHTQAAQKLGVQGYPTIKVYRDGALQGDYDSGRTADAIIKYVKGNSGPAVTAVESADALEALKADNSVVVALFSTSEVTEAFKKAASALRATAKFVHVADATGVADGAIVVFKHFDSKRDEFNGDATDSAAIQKFVAGASVRLFDEIGPDNYKMYVDRQLPMGWLFVKPSAADAAETKKQVEAIAGDFAGKLSLVWIDADKYGQMAGRLGLQGVNFPSFAIDHQGQHFAWENKPINSADIKAFLQDYVDGKLQPSIKSEEAPAEHTVNGLTTVVGKTFDELVLNADADVLIAAVASWCGHCKSLKPIYAELAAELKDNDKVRIAIFDAAANDFNTKLFNVQGFPTIFWVPKATREPVQYEGDRSKEALLKFINERLSA